MALEAHKKDLDRHNKTKARKSKLEIVHLTMDEIISLNRMQKSEENPTGQYVDPATGLREYSRMSGILRIPEIRDLFISTKETLHTGEDLPDEVTQIVEQNPPNPEEFIPIPSDDDPATQELESAGHGDDTKVALMPTDVIKFFAHLNGTEDKDPQFKVPAFGGMSDIVRVGLTIGGALLGVATVGAGFGLMGAMAGGALGGYTGNVVGRTVTGQPLGDAFKAAAPNLLYGAAIGAAGAPAGAGWFSAGAPAAAAGSGAAAGAAGAAGAAPAIGAGTGAAAGAGAGAGAAAASPSLLGGAGSLLGGGFASVQPYLLPGALLAGGMMMSSKGDKKKQEEWDKEKEEHDKLMKDLRDYNHQPLDATLTTHPAPYVSPDYGWQQSQTRRRYKEGGTIKDVKMEIDRLKKYKKGGAVTAISLKGIPLKGPGDGQADLIKQHIPKDTWINDAEFVSRMGNGTTEAGHKAIHEFEGFIKKDLYPLYKDKLKEQSKKVDDIPCAVANGEHPTPRLLVGALGKGSFEEGAKVMREVREEVRKEIRKGSIKNIPPSVKPMKVYYDRVMQRRGE